MKLHNGLTLFLFRDERKHSVLVNFITKLGSTNSTYTVDGKKNSITNGIPHLLEHLLIESSSYGNLIRVFGEMQMSPNGTTYPDRTEFYFNAVERAEEALPILLKAIDCASFTEKDVEKVKGAIYEEIRRGEDSKGKKLFSLANACLFQKLPYRNGLGTLEEVESISFEEVKKVYESFYTFSNQYLVITGNFDEEEMISLVEEICKDIPLRKSKMEIPLIEEPIEVKRKRGTVYLPTGINLVQINYKIDLSSYSPRERVKLDYYLNYFCRMNFGTISTCSVDLQKDKSIVGGIYFDQLILDHFFILKIEANTMRESVFVSKIQSVLKKPFFDESLFDLYQKESKIHIALREENVSHLASSFIDNFFTFSYPHLDTVFQIESYSFKDFEETIKSLSFTQYSVCTIEDKVE